MSKSKSKSKTKKSKAPVSKSGASGTFAKQFSKKRKEASKSVSKRKSGSKAVSGRTRLGEVPDALNIYKGGE